MDLFRFFNLEFRHVPVARMAIVLLLSAFSFLLFSSVAQAFKVETHVWVGQQVLNDLEVDGMITIPIGGEEYEYPVDPIVVNALRQYPREYRLGNIGPDALPDIFTGQFVVHPGSPDAQTWQTDDWLKWVYAGADAPRDKAFAYGYLAHAATDLFSHTYVNEYSGDIFSLTDGEIEVEKRHLALESYIVQRTPLLTDAAGSYIGKPYEVLSTPAKFIRNRLILNDTVAYQYTNGPGIAPHLASVHKLRKSLADAYDPLGDVDTWVTQLLAAYYLDLNLNEEDAQKVYEYAQKLNTLLNDASGIEQLQQAKDDFVDLVVETAGMGMELQDKFDQALLDIVEISSRVDGKALELARKQDELANTIAQFCEEQCEDVTRIVFSPVPPVCWPAPEWDDPGNWDCWYPPAVPNEVVETVCSSICNPNPLHVSLEEIVQELINAKNDINEELLKAHQALNEAIDLATQNAIAELQAQNDLINAMIDTGQRMSSDLNIVRANVDGWRKDINDGMEAYVLAATETIKEAMKADGHPLQPLQDWYSCWGLAITAGVPGPINQGVCTIEKRIESISDAIDDFEELLGSIDPVTNVLNTLKQKVKDEVRAIAEEAAYDLFENLTDVDVETIVDLFTEPMTAAALNDYYSTDTSGKDLVLINDIAGRVDAEMHLTPAGYFDPEQYAVAYNSVVLAKLTLLGPEQLNLLADDAGLLSSVYPDGAPLYPESGELVNIIFDVILSIDGNHHWMTDAPPYPRRKGGAQWPKDEYGYDRDDAEGGLRIWHDPTARTNIFLEIFKGPLVPGIEVPGSINFSTLLPRSFPYEVCLSNPFPLSTDDKTCRQENAAVALPLQAIQALTSSFRGRSAEAREAAPGQQVRIKANTSKFAPLPQVGKKTISSKLGTGFTKIFQRVSGGLIR